MSSGRTRTRRRPWSSSSVQRSTRPLAPPRHIARARPRGSRSLFSFAQPRAQLLKCLGIDVVVSPQALALGADDAGIAQNLEVVRDRRLGEVEERDKLADADLAGVFPE